MGVVRRTPTSHKDYQAIWDYLAENASEDVADRVLRAFDKRIAFLSEHPSAGRARPEFGRRLRSMPVGKYLLFYRRARGGIELVRVIHGARDLKRLFKR